MTGGKNGRPRGLAVRWAACALSVAVVSGCAGGGTSGESAGDGAADGAWALPVEAYLPTRKEEQAITQARAALLKDCMGKQGFSYDQSPELPEIGGQSLTDGRYGIWERDDVERWGYHPDPELLEAHEKATAQATDLKRELSQAERTALYGKSEASVEGHGPGGCAREVSVKLGEGATDTSFTEPAEAMANDAYGRAQREPDVRKAFQSWSACMKKQGYDYRTPMYANDDAAFAGRDISDKELAVARTDLDCREKYQVNRVWYEQEARWQKLLIEEKADPLNEVRLQSADVVRKAQQVLEASR
ncbi:hypothetical protein AB0B50_32350 [Streptomyces sp. NPDC041068]|uniref:hypothetical protein n=1 Tax=Streptomyces sp. NPDC041068 TaxID=3155130 RepID=UPI0033F440ED